MVHHDPSFYEHNVVNHISVTHRPIQQNNILVQDVTQQEQLSPYDNEYYHKPPLKKRSFRSFNQLNPEIKQITRGGQSVPPSVNHHQDVHAPTENSMTEASQQWRQHEYDLILQRGRGSLVLRIK